MRMQGKLKYFLGGSAICFVINRTVENIAAKFAVLDPTTGVMPFAKRV